MTSAERRAVTALAGIFSLRMFGLFLILPVFVLYAEELSGTTPLMIGMALGAYGLTQAVFQIPYGMASDRFGRKPMIALGLVVFAAGCVVAALSDTILGVVLGRGLQGMGAIAAVVIAATADLTRETQRTKAMAVVGMTIGATFLLSLMLGPVFNAWIGVRGIFWLTAALAIGGIGLLYWRVPTPVRATRQGGGRPLADQFRQVLRDADLLRLDLGIFVLHLVLTAMFVVVPVALVRSAGLAADMHWKIYLPVILLSVVGMIPVVLLSARKRLIRWVFSGGVAFLALSQVLLYRGYGNIWTLAFALWVFFVGFNVLEALLPSLVSRVAPADSKGTAVGVYNSFEFFGAFLGGAVGGYVYGAYGLAAVFVLCGILLLLWLGLALASPEPPLLETEVLRLDPRAPQDARDLAERLTAVPGVAEAIVVMEEGVAYLKVDRKVVDKAVLEQLVAPGP